MQERQLIWGGMCLPRDAPKPAQRRATLGKEGEEGNRLSSPGTQSASPSPSFSLSHPLSRSGHQERRAVVFKRALKSQES